ncbi:hypothetical protein GGX14DRAFT_573394 [Mycena pura]|uniref:Uncharacterized protein n=1 Tax=Mycena pura TaxID=153505 RepID=A0AAD6V010_9AGAR|nr:hypothetical protein GGX14DRAFT_573394 [Mycena pura]
MVTPFSCPALKTTGIIMGVSAPCELPGVSSVVLLMVQPVAPFLIQRHVVTIEHEEGEPISFSSVFSLVDAPSVPHFETSFVTEDLVGSVVVEDTEDSCLIRTCKISSIGLAPDSTSLVKLHRKVFDTHDLALCFVYKGHLYDSVEEGVSIQIQHISRNSLTSGHCKESGLSVRSIGDRSNYRPFCFILPSTPFYGISAAFIHFNESFNLDSMKVIFLPSTATHAPDDGEASPLAFASSCKIAYICGRPLNVSLVWMDHSGFNVTVVVDAFEGPALMHVRYHPEMASTSVHKLQVPETINLHTLKAVCVDHTAGTVHVVDDRGVFSTLYYV